MTTLIHSNIALEVGFPAVLDLANIPYYSSFRDFLNSLLINSNHWSHVIYVRLGYMANHVVSTKFTIGTAHLLSYYDILGHPVTGLIIVMDLIFKFYLFTFTSMM